MMKVQFTLTSLTPLLMHNDNLEGDERLKQWRSDPANANISVPGDDRAPGWSWQNCLYSDGEHVCLPSDNFMAMLRQAGARVIMKRQKTFKESTQSGIILSDEFLEFSCDSDRRIRMADITKLEPKPFVEQLQAVKALGFRLFMKRARIGNSKHVRVRPRFDKWKVTGTMIIQAPEITFDKLEIIMAEAGKLGLCDWRPSSKSPGPFGMFSSSISQIN